MYHACETQIRGLTSIRRERVLPRPGRILVSPGDRVEATQVVARTDLPGDFRILAVARRLGVSASKIEEYLQVDLGDTVQRGTVIARRGGFARRSIESPIDGVVTAKGEGRILIEAQPTPFELHAHIPGIVLEVDDSGRVVIQARGALIQGAWGSNGESVGVLKVMTDRPHSPLDSRSIDPSCHGAILIGGVTLEQRVLERAEDIEARGLITGGLITELVPVVEQLPFPILVTDGIGEIPMADPIFDLLSENEGEEASIAGHVEPRWRRRRPEVIIPKPDQDPRGSEEGGDGKLVVGTRVRIVRAPYRGCIGEIVGLPRRARRIETGARVHCAEVDIGQDVPVSVPLVNLDVLRYHSVKHPQHA
ncbi:MAG: hypothetical protein U9R72_05645 [Chloroflexota bacterium]|nr:hypothetical protein [Chloroflexota bacterium]